MDAFHENAKNVAMEFQLQNNLTIYTAFNTPYVYTRNWKDFFEETLLNRPLSSLDAIVLGPMHNYRGTQGTSFRKVTLAYQEEHPELKIDFMNQQAPGLLEFSNNFRGPIIWLGMFAKKRSQQQLNEVLEVMQQLKQERGRKNILAVSPRKYVADLGNEECVNDSGQVGTCLMDRSCLLYTSPSPRDRG